MRILHPCFVLRQLGGVETSALEAAFREADRSEYQPFFALLERNAQKFPELSISILVPGAWLEKAAKWSPDLLRRLRRLVNSESVELILTPYDGGLSWFSDQEAAAREIRRMQEKIGQAFGVRGKVLAMPRLFYDNQVAKYAAENGLIGVIGGEAEGALGFLGPDSVFEGGEFREEGADLLAESPEYARVPVIFQNTRLSEAIRRAEAPTTVEVAQENGDRPEDENEVRATASLETERKVFSAPRFLKSLELEALKGDVITLALDTTIFGRYREQGVVRFFDEVIIGWLGLAKHQIWSASRVFDELKPKAEISVPKAVDWRGETMAYREKQSAKAAVPAAKVGESAKKDESTQERLVQTRARKQTQEAQGAQSQETRQGRPEQTQELANEQPQKAAEARRQVQATEEEPKLLKEAEEAPFDVKVHIKKKVAMAKRPTIVTEPTQSDATNTERGDGVPETDEVDDVAAEVQIMAQRLSREKESLGLEDFENLQEAEVVEFWG